MTGSPTCGDVDDGGEGHPPTIANRMPAVPPSTSPPATRARRARAGVLRTAHGDVRTPAFVPLATKATVKGL